MMTKSPFCSLFQVTGAPHLPWKEIFRRASGDQEGWTVAVKKKKENKNGQRGADPASCLAVVGRVPGTVI